jgi:hypothetical protein
MVAGEWPEGGRLEPDRGDGTAREASKVLQHHAANRYSGPSGPETASVGLHRLHTL